MPHTFANCMMICSPTSKKASWRGRHCSAQPKELLTRVNAASWLTPRSSNEGCSVLQPVRIWFRWGLWKCSYYSGLNSGPRAGCSRWGLSNHGDSRNVCDSVNKHWKGSDVHMCNVFTHRCKNIIHMHIFASLCDFVVVARVLLKGPICTYV